MDMDTDALRWLQQVADGTTVTEVSEVEPVTQSGVSRALARLEEQIGTPLLRRSGRTLRMTHAGAVFKPHLDALLHHLDDGIAAVSQLVDPDTGTVALAFQQSLGTWLVPDLARSFRAARPHVQFQLTQVRDELRSAPLDGGRADLELGTRRPSSREAPPRTNPTRPCTRGWSRSSRCAWRCRGSTAWPASRASAWPTSPRTPSSACVRPRRCASGPMTCANRPDSGPPSSSKATTCPTCAVSSPPGLASPWSPPPARDHRSRRPDPWSTPRSWTRARSGRSS
jgi:DNA-binding transcriptional LysR family regulator